MDHFILKATGERELFDPAKLMHSLQHAGASHFTAEEIAKTIIQELREEQTTTHIYKRAFALLKKKEKRPAIRYSLKRSITQLGPTGFPFELFIAEIFRNKGFEAYTNLILQGTCVTHEVDVLLANQQEVVMVEAKFHNDLGFKSDTKVALYVKARVDDVKGRAHMVQGKQYTITHGLLITNTKFSTSALDYGACAGLNMISWDYPMRGNLHDLINETGIHPITCVGKLSIQQKRDLIEKRLVTCAQLKHALYNDYASIASIIPASDIGKIKKEIDFVCV